VATESENPAVETSVSSIESRTITIEGRDYSAEELRGIANFLIGDNPRFTQNVLKLALEIIAGIDPDSVEYVDSDNLDDSDSAPEDDVE